MKTKRNKNFVTHKRKKNKKLIKNSLKKSKNVTRKIIQKGGEWIQPLFRIYDESELNLDNCGMINYDPSKDDYLDFQERNTNILKGMFSVRNTDEKTACINKYKYFNTYFLPFDRQLYYLNNIEQFKTSENVNSVSKILILGYLNVIRYFRKIWETTDFRTLETHIRSQQFQLYAGNNIQNILVNGDLNRSKQNLYNVAFSLLSPTITEAFASGNDCYYMNNYGTRNENKHFIWLYYFSNLSLLSKIKNEAMKLINYKFTREMKSSYYNYIELTPEKLLNLFQNYKPHISPIDFISNNQRCDSLIRFIYGNISQEQIELYRTLFSSIEDTNREKYYSVMMNTRKLDIIQTDQYFIPQILNSGMALNFYNNDNNEINNFFSYDLEFSFQFDAVKTSNLTKIQSSINELNDRIQTIFGDSINRPAGLNINGNFFVFPEMLPIIKENMHIPDNRLTEEQLHERTKEITRTDNIKERNFRKLFRLVMFYDIQNEQQINVILVSLRKLSTRGVAINIPEEDFQSMVLNLRYNHSLSEQNLTDGINSLNIKLSIFDIVKLLIGLNILPPNNNNNNNNEPNNNIYINRLLEFVRIYNLSKTDFAQKLLNVKTVIPVRDDDGQYKFSYGGVFSKYCDSTSIDWTRDNSIQFSGTHLLELPKSNNIKLKYIALVNAFVRNHTNGMIENYIDTMTNINNNTKDNYGSFIYNSNENGVITSYMIYISKICDSNLVKLADFFQVTKIENGVLTSNCLIIWNNKKLAYNNQYVADLREQIWSLCFNKQFLAPIFSIQTANMIDEPDDPDEPFINNAQNRVVVDIDDEANLPGPVLQAPPVLQGPPVKKEEFKKITPSKSGKYFSPTIKTTINRGNLPKGGKRKRIKSKKLKKL